MRGFILFLIFSIAIYPIPSFANRSKTLKKGEKAPFSGTLLDLEAVAKILADKETSKARCKIQNEANLAKKTAKCNLNLNSCKISYKIEKNKLSMLLNIKNEELKRLAKLAYKPKKDLTILWFAIGVSVGIGATIGVAFAVKEVTR